MNKYPNTITYSGDLLLKMVDNANFGSDLLKYFRETANNLLTCERLSVVDRKLRAISGDPHDYMSMGPYWWPNSDTASGLPYIRKDGLVNPETQEPVGYDRLCESVHTLALAALYFKDKNYAEKASEMLYDWHLNPKTYMNPHLEYGQSIPGICSGRGIGLIDFACSYHIFNAAAILEYMNAIDKEILDGLKRWYTDFVNWMLTSEKGIDEDNQHNNHGTWFDVQVASAAIFTNRPILAKKTLTAAYERRFISQIADDGSQPYELVRTKAMGYSLVNLEGLSLIGNMAVRLHIKRPYWKNDGERPDLLRLAIDFLYPYAMDMSTFPYRELSDSVFSSDIAPHLSRAAYYYPDMGYEEKAARLIDETMIWRLVPQV